jgi:hypothetical protein
MIPKPHLNLGPTPKGAGCSTSNIRLLDSEWSSCAVPNGDSRCPEPGLDRHQRTLIGSLADAERRALLRFLMPVRETCYVAAFADRSYREKGCFFDSCTVFNRFLSRPTWLADGFGPRTALRPRGRFTPIVGSPVAGLPALGLGIQRRRTVPALSIIQRGPALCATVLDEFEPRGK